jgi:ribosomal protein S18 acetylase RimI-like enzyme
MLERRGYDETISFGAFENGKIVAFMLNGQGIWDGRQAAYDMGTGTVSEFRRQGLAEKIFKAAVPVLKNAGIEQYLLEVIRVNTKAIDLYKKQGFEITRELDYYIASKDKIIVRRNTGNLELKRIDNPDWQVFAGFWDFQPSWQNSPASVDRKRNHFHIIGAYIDKEIAGYGIAERRTGDIPQLAVAENFRGQGIASVIFSELLKHNESSTVRVINAEASYTPFRQFMSSLNAEPGHGQYEMTLSL